MKSRLRKYTDLIKYPPCHYSIEGRADALFDDDMINPTIDVETTLHEDDGKEDDGCVGYISDDDSTNDVDGVPGFSPDAVEFIENEIDEYFDDDTVNNEDDEPTEAQLKAATSIVFNDTLTKIIKDANK